MHNNNQPPNLEITVISAQDLKKGPTKIFSRCLRRFVCLSTTTPTIGSKHMKIYRTSVDDTGGINPTWGDTIRMHLDRTFFSQRYPGIYVELYSKHLFRKTQLGWCLIPVTDFLNGFSPVGLTQFLSYKLRDRDGSRGTGVVNVAVKLKGYVGMPYPPMAFLSNVSHFPGMNGGDQTVIGIPVRSRNFY